MVVASAGGSWLVRSHLRAVETSTHRPILLTDEALNETPLGGADKRHQARRGSVRDGVQGRSDSDRLQGKIEKGQALAEIVAMPDTMEKE